MNGLRRYILCIKLTDNGSWAILLAFIGAVWLSAVTPTQYWVLSVCLAELCGLGLYYIVGRGILDFPIYVWRLFVTNPRAYKYSSFTVEDYKGYCIKRHNDIDQ